MAIFFSVYISSSLLLLLQLFFVTTNGSTLTDVCLQTRVPPVCFAVLDSDPRSKSAGLQQLAQIAMDIAKPEATNNKLKIHGLLLTTKTPQVYRACMLCLDLYTEIQQDIRNAEDELKGRKLSEVYKWGLQLRENVIRCEAAFGIDSPVKRENLDMAIVGEVISVIAKNLQK